MILTFLSRYSESGCEFVVRLVDKLLDLSNFISLLGTNHILCIHNGMIQNFNERSYAQFFDRLNDVAYNQSKAAPIPNTFFCSNR